MHVSRRARMDAPRHGSRQQRKMDTRGVLR